MEEGGGDGADARLKSSSRKEFNKAWRAQITWQGWVSRWPTTIKDPSWEKGSKTFREISEHTLQAGKQLV